MMTAVFSSIPPGQWLVSLAVVLAGVVSAALYLRKHQQINAALVLLAALALALTLAGLRLPAGAAAPIVIQSDAPAAVTAAQLQRLASASAVELRGDGLRDAEWRDVPARPLQWAPKAAELLWLDFPRTLALGRQFTLKVRRGEAQAGWRLQLLAENRQVLADSGPAAKASTTQSVQWLPPVAEAMVLQARILDAAGKVQAQGPLPLQVRVATPLQVRGLFDAPSFDARSLNQLLVDGGALVDWNVTLGKAIARQEAAREALTAPNLLFADAAYIEHLAPAARSALLAQVRQGVPLVVLGGNAADAALWQREFGLHLQAQSATTEQEDMRQFALAGTQLSLAPAPWNPAGQSAGWSVLAQDDRKQPWLWQRELQRGRVIWLGLTEWHRYAISAPQALAAWWQVALDTIALPSKGKLAWQLDDPLPLAGLRSELCVQGAPAGAMLQVEGLQQPLQRRRDKADAACAAVWPAQTGWLTMTLGGTQEAERLYVYGSNDWPAWQRALRRDATARYAARHTPQGMAQGQAMAAASPATSAQLAAPATTALLPLAPAGLLFIACMLALWWREQFSPVATAARRPEKV
ncbi:hypothetical protein GTP23_15810 [Pseudoduganella sp. FT93W]|uniref:Uncharacterized protein n=1 Tax=Duganella fentianensis TaxID=2692177 RepID=A0A845HZQ3_9BURK|nr:hypothetical protein [Duganella fentianensis]MYN46513.1 hypothetical protein [Duganella fentianensis]